MEPLISYPDVEGGIRNGITGHIISILDRGTAPWRIPFMPKPGEGNSLPRNPISQKHYRGINVFLLAISVMIMGYGSSQ